MILQIHFFKGVYIQCHLRMGIDTLQVRIPFAGQGFKIFSSIQQEQGSVLQQVQSVLTVIEKPHLNSSRAYDILLWVIT